MLIASVLLGKLSSFFIKTFTRRSASTWPGHLTLESNPSFIRMILERNSKLKIVLIAGTNGKTTTTKALHHILEKQGLSIERNSSGANLLNGFASMLINYSNIIGNIRKDALLFEVDENSLPLILKEIKRPHALVLLNLFRDQLDRYGEVNKTSEKWLEAIKSLPKESTVIANADDPQIVRIANKALCKKVFYSIPDNLKKEKSLSHAVDSTTCPDCFSELKYSNISYSHIGSYKCPKCKFTNPISKSLTLKTNLKGTFNHYNLTAAILCANAAFDIKTENGAHAIEDFKPAFGRQEELSYRGKSLMILLSKNPTGFNESLKIVKEKKYTNLLLVLNDRIPDGRDISWIWDVDFENLPKNISISVSGDRAYDLASRLQYSGIDKINVHTDLKEALDKTAGLVKKDGKLIVLPTYSAMLDLRKIIIGKSIL